MRQLPLIQRKDKLREVIDKSGLPDVLCGKYVEGRGVDLFKAVCEHNLEGMVAKRKIGMYATVSGWLKIKNPNYTESERRHELFDSFKANTSNRLPAIPKKPPLRAVPVPRKTRRSRRLKHGDWKAFIFEESSHDTFAHGGDGNKSGRAERL